MKKKLIASVAATAAGAILLVGCSAAGPETSASPSAAANPLTSVAWSEDADGVPAITFDQPFSVDTSAAHLVADGDGEELKEGQIVSLAYTITNGDDGSVVYSTYTDDTPESVPLVSSQMDPVLLDILVGAHVGADFLYSVVDTTTDPASTVIMAVTVVNTVTPLAKAEGTAVEPVEGLPVVTLDDTGKPSVEIPKTDPPTKLQVQPTIKGDGDVVEEGDNVTVHYTGWLWDGTQFDSSWDKGTPASFTLADGQLIDGWVQGLAGQTVGSQVLLVIPPELGYGDDDAANGAIPGGSTLVFVVDILAAS